jgi:hypothetical protein
MHPSQKYKTGMIYLKMCGKWDMKKKTSNEKMGNIFRTTQYSSFFLIKIVL